jgi:hypothetical protein
MERESERERQWAGDEISTTNVFAKLRKATICALMAVCMEQQGFHWTDFHEILYLRIF